MDNPKTILIIQLKRAGDLLVTTPVFPILKKRFPNAHLDVMTEKPFADLLDHQPYVDGVYRYDREQAIAAIREVRARTYDWIIDFQSSPRSALLCLLSNARLTAGYQVPFWGRVYQRSVKRPGGKISVVDGKLSLIEALIGPVSDRPPRAIFLTDDEKRWATTAMPSDDQPVGLISTHRRNSRRWHAESFVRLGKRLLEAGYPVWLFWGPGEEAYVQAIQRQLPSARMIPKTSFREMAALLGRCQLVITNDNGPMHLAVSVGAPTITIYGPTDPVAWNPGGPRHTVLRADGLACLGCNMNECPFGHECMTGVSADRVYEQCLTFLRRPHEVLS